MTIRLSAEDYFELRWQNPQLCDLFDPSDRLYRCPQQFGRGYERRIELPGIELMILNQELHQELQLEFDAEDSEAVEVDESEQLEIGFNLSGQYGDRTDNIHFLDWFTYEEPCSAGFLETTTKGRMLKVDLHFHSPQLLQSFLPANQEILPIVFHRMLEGIGEEYVHEGNITAAMRLALEQIANCSFQGMVKRLYLEAKCLELIALKLDYLIRSSGALVPKTELNLEDIDRIHQAKDILLENLLAPPSLLELARRIGLNDYKLKVGFQQVFKTTVFGYLHQHRMAEAGRLLLGTRMKVHEVACAVGYVNQSRFAAAFRKHFGVNPSTYRG